MLAADMRKLLGREDLTMEELVESSNELLSGVAPRQTRYKVTDRPDARTIRYYVTQDLLPKPVSYEGGRARYGGRHVLRLLAIKKLQADHLTLSKIKSLLSRSSDEEILGLLGGENETAPRLAPRGPAEVEAGESVPVSAEATVRFNLAGGGSVDLPRDALEQPARRQEIANQLRAIAQTLVDPED